MNTQYARTETLIEKVVRVMNNPDSTKLDWYNLGLEIGKSTSNFTISFSPAYAPSDVYYTETDGKTTLL